MIESAPIQLKTIVTTKDQTVQRRVAVRFSWLLWLKNLGQRDWEPDGPRRFGFGLGNYEVFEPFLIPQGSSFIMFELAIVNINIDRLLALPTKPITAETEWTKIRMSGLGPKFEYVEVEGS